MFDYGNARLRAMKSQLLSGPRLEALAEARTLPGLLTELARTPYRKAAEAASVRAAGVGSIALMLRGHLLETLGKVRRFYKARALDQVMLLLRRYDVHNLKTILRGLAQNIPPEEISTALLPIGELTMPVLDALLAAAEPRAAIDLLATLHLSSAQPLLEARARRPGAAVWELELALERWHFAEARRHRLAQGALAEALALEADMVNLMTMLRFAHAPAERQRLRGLEGLGELSALLVAPGRLSEKQLLRTGAAATVEEALAALEGSPYARPLAAGFAAYRQSRRLSDLERALWRYKVRHLALYISRDALGIGVPVGYIALKDNEARNIRAIAWGIYLRQPADSIRQSLEIIA